MAMKHTEHPKPNAPLEAHNMKEMTIRNSVEKLECEKRQKIIEKQRSYFVRQHSRDENEIKQILLRLQQEQETIHDDAEGSPLSSKCSFLCSFTGMYYKEETVFLNKDSCLLLRELREQRIKRVVYMKLSCWW